MKLFAKKLTDHDVDEIIKSKLKWILEATKPDKIILFGSAACGEMTDASDIDLILIFPDHSDLKKIAEKLFISRPKTDLWPQDLLIETHQSYNIKVQKGGGACYIASLEGKILYETKNIQQ